MQDSNQILPEWTFEILESLGKSNALCVALFGADKKLLFATPVMHELFKDEPSKSFINPTFDKLLSLRRGDPLLYDGILTIGDYVSINSSIEAQVYMKEDKLLVVGGANASQLQEQNVAMHQLNQQINNLHRQLLKEKSTLVDTLNQLNESNSLLQQAVDTKDKFFSIIAHDLKSPFNAIVGFSEILMELIEEKNYENIGEHVSTILQSSNQAMGLLKNLLEWARSQTGSMSFNPEQFSLMQFLADMNALFEGPARQKAIRVRIVAPHDLLVFADKNMLNIVLRNLISNAIKFTKPGGEVIISSVEKQNSIHFTVEDTGVGIAPDKIGKLFSVGQNFTTRGTNMENGTGLGLILCNEFVEKHGGEIGVQSELNKGSIFYFSLPGKK
ncbi:ATP-binding protein [Mangrovibacterium sp.]|uniref:sensor histidine kinase n=1 Tax=Mangrovibacterium sp. TaxID=1961364 RepID=UPI003566463D